MFWICLARVVLLVVHGVLDRESICMNLLQRMFLASSTFYSDLCRFLVEWSLMPILSLVGALLP